MTPSATRRGNAFLIAAAVLPLLVVGFFLLATAIPRWTVPPPAHDLVFVVDEPSRSAPALYVFTFGVRDGRVVATITWPNERNYAPDTTMYVYDHATGDVRAIAVVDADGATPVPEAPGTSVTFVVADLASRPAVAGPTAPDGYTFEPGGRSRGGIMGEIFGMGSSRNRASIGKDSRVLPLDVPAAFPGAVRAVGWLVSESQDD